MCLREISDWKTNPPGDREAEKCSKVISKKTMEKGLPDALSIFPSISHWVYRCDETIDMEICY